MERLSKLLAWMAALLSTFIIVSILADIVLASLTHFSWSFLVEAPLVAGRKGGILPIIVSTLLIVMLTLVFVIPVGLLTAIYLCDYNYSARYASIVRKLVEILSAVPSIVFGLFGNALFCLYFKMGFSILSGALTLACMALPLFIATVERAISSLPRAYVHTSESLGIGQFTLFKSILLPNCSQAIVVGITLSVGRALAETAALIFTSGYVDRMPRSIWDSGRALSVHIYDLAMNVPGGDINAYKSAFVLIALILFINSLFSIFANIIKDRRYA